MVRLEKVTVLGLPLRRARQLDKRQMRLMGLAALLFVLAALGGMEGFFLFVLVLAIFTALVASSLGRSSDVAEAPFAIEAGKEGLSVDGHLALPRWAIKQAVIVPGKASGSTVLLERRLGTPVEIYVRDPAEGGELLRALELDASRAPPTFQLSSLVPAALSSAPRVVFMGGAVAHAVLIVALAPVAVHWPPTPVTLAAALLVLPLLLVQRRMELVVGNDGVMTRWLGRRRFYRYADIASVSTSVEGAVLGFGRSIVELRMRTGEIVRLLVGVTPPDASRARVIEARIREAPALRGVGAVEGLAQLQRGARPVDAWLRSLRAAGSGANVDPRTAPLLPEQLVRVLEDSGAPPDARAGAAAALAAQGDGRERRRIEALAEGMVEPGLREAILAATIEDATALEAALDTVAEHARRRR